ncbi:hypothetical protein HAZT_HAZT003906 [Hyalella azteca]|uniref:RING-type domain-containing protein n=1 Tax=Hyalella azteca TaxID=294128 RepID=A0A6A0H674_HYAAZ|nr:hypothetical protein HAZT_HAZT003906 [Hyalella azteca]
MAPVRCIGCRTQLLDSENHRLLDAHSAPLHSSSTGSEDICPSLKDKSHLYLDAENLPNFAYSAVMESGFTTARLKCPKCSSRIGAFNFVKGCQCGCGAHILPSVHLIFSKVDYSGYAVSAAGSSMSCSSDAAEDEVKEPLLLRWDDTLDPAGVTRIAQASQSPPSNSHIRNCDMPTVSVINISNSVHPSSSSASISSTNSPSTCVTTTTTTAGTCASTIDSTTKVATTSTSEYPELIDYPDHLLCAICLELLFSPFCVKPCSHVFCEPCLRRLARPCPTNTACPLCREIIGACLPAAEYSREVRQKYPNQVAERQKFEQNHSAQHLPLPWLQNYRFLNFSSTRHPRSGVYTRYSNWWRTALWIFWVDAIGFLLILTLNWFLTQNMGGSEQQLPSPPHLPVSHNPAVVLDGSGDGGGFKPRRGSDGGESFEHYIHSMGARENAIKGMASTDYQQYIKYHSPHTASPIQTTAYTASPGDRPLAHNEKTVNFMDANVVSNDKNDADKSSPNDEYDLKPSSEEAKRRQRRYTKRIPVHFFNSFDSFGDVGIDFDEHAGTKTLEGDSENEHEVVTKAGSTQPRARFNSRTRSSSRLAKGVPDSDDVAAEEAVPPQEGVRWVLA